MLLYIQYADLNNFKPVVIFLQDQASSTNEKTKWSEYESALNECVNRMAQAAWEVTFIRISQQNVFLFKRREIHISLSLALALADIINFQIYKKIGRPVDNINLIFKVGEVPVEVQEARKSILIKVELPTKHVSVGRDHFLAVWDP